jgi:hypothetical protein
MWSFLVIRLENVLKGQGAEISALQSKADTETGQSMVSLVHIPRLENSRCAIGVET